MYEMRKESLKEKVKQFSIRQQEKNDEMKNSGIDIQEVIEKPDPWLDQKNKDIE